MSDSLRDKIAAMRQDPKFRLLPTSGRISASDINTALSRPATARLSLNDYDARELAEKLTGRIAYSDFYGKVAEPFIREDIIDTSKPFTLDPECKRVEYEMVAGGGGGAGGHAYTDTNSGNGAGGGGAAQYKTGGFNVADRNLYIVIGKGGQGGRGGLCSGNPSNAAEAGSYGANTDIRVGSASGTVLAWVQGGQGGQVPEQSAYGWSGAGGNDGDGNPGGAHVGSGSGINGNTGSGRAGGSGGAKGGHGGQAGQNGGGWDVTPPAGNEMAGCGGGGGQSAAPWGGNGGKGGATALKALSGHNWLFYKAEDATGYGHGGGGGCKTGIWDEMVNQDAGTGGNGAPGRVRIKQFRK